MRRALVVHKRMPAFDRDSGSQDVDNMVRFLLDDGWQLTFLSEELEGRSDPRHVARLRDQGVATYGGFDWADRVLANGRFDLVVVAFWELAAQLLPKIRARCPAARVVVSSMDVHFLRTARQSFGQGSTLANQSGRDFARELNTYNRADAVLCVSDKEQALLEDFLGTGRVHTLPLAEDVARSRTPLDERRGLFFVGNFAHPPNVEAVEHLVKEVLPLVDPDLLVRHPVRIAGSGLDDARLDLGALGHSIEVLGWIPSVEPELAHARAVVVPLLHGAGVKRKVLQPMMAGTPVVTTPMGAEGLDIVAGTHALVADGPGDFAAAITRILVDDELWRRLADAGAQLVEAHHRPTVVGERFRSIVEQVLAAPGITEGRDGRRSDLRAAAAIAARLHALVVPGDIVLVASGGDEALVAHDGYACWHFPRSREGRWAGYEPVDGTAAVRHLEALRAEGARWVVLPTRAAGWHQAYPELGTHLARHAERVHRDDALELWRLAEPASLRLTEHPPTRITVLGAFGDGRNGPEPAVSVELAASSRHTVEQEWTSGSLPTSPDGAEATHRILIDDRAVLPSRFVDRLLDLHATLDADRIQPTHRLGPDAGPPGTERHGGSVARQVAGPVALPVLSVRPGADAEGPVVLVDALSVGLDGWPAGAAAVGDERAGAAVTGRLWVADDDGSLTVLDRPEPAPGHEPEISVLVSTYDRPDLLRDSLASLAAQTLDRHRYEVVVVDDGSTAQGAVEVAESLAAATPGLQVVAVRIAHAGRSAAKDHALMLARAPVVLFFDDDDRAAPDLLERHVDAHRAHPGDDVAVLGHTDWATEVPVGELMRFVTEVEHLMFAYSRLEDGQQLDWRGFWEGRVSCKRALLLAGGLHDQRLDYSIDVELAWRLAQHAERIGGRFRVRYEQAARSEMVRPLTAAEFAGRTRGKGRAAATIAVLHPNTEVAGRMLGQARAIGPSRDEHSQSLLARIEAAEAASPPDTGHLHDLYRQLVARSFAQGVGDLRRGGAPPRHVPPVTVPPLVRTEPAEPAFVADDSPSSAADEPALTVTLPVWSRTPQLAAMAQATIARLWEVARLPTEVVVVDNGSPHQVDLAAKVFRYEHNRGVSVGWNAGIRLATAPVVAVLNSDCQVEPGWDEALYEAVTTGRRIAFPFTDHCDGRGYTRPDQGGTAGWCFMLTQAVYDQVGPFDEWFSPAFCEDTDYWHRAWQLGIELTPVPAARVVHARRTSSSDRADLLLQAHRYKYGWKHGVDPDRAPPYYDRDIRDFYGSTAPPG